MWGEEDVGLGLQMVGERQRETGGRLFHSHFLCPEIRRTMLLLGNCQGRGQRRTLDSNLVWVSLQLCTE